MARDQLGDGYKVDRKWRREKRAEEKREERGARKERERERERAQQMRGKGGRALTLAISKGCLSSSSCEEE